MSDSKPLTGREEDFCRHYIATKFNATEAAILAGYSEKNARTIGSENLTKLDIQNRIAELMAETVKRAKASADDVFAFATRAAFFDIGEVLEMDEGGVYFKEGKKLSDLPLATRQMIQNVKSKQTQFGVVNEVIFVDKMKNLDMLARFLSMYKDQVTVKKDGELTPEEREELDELRREADGSGMAT